jgi:ornithine carbamoyltransferase
MTFIDGSIVSILPITQLGESGINEILSLAENMLVEGFETAPLVAGLVQRNLSSIEKMIVEASLAKLGGSLVHHQWPDGITLSEGQMLDDVIGFSRIVDLLIVGYTDDLTFGRGRSMMEKISKVSVAPLIGLQDDWYAHPSALSHLLGFKSHLSELKGRRIAVSWAFGQKLSLPRVPHSLLRIAPSLGINIRVVAPRKFQLLKRILKDVAAHASALDIEIEQSEDFDTAFDDCDAVYALPWIRFDNYNHPDRNLEDAQEFKDWFFTKEIIPNSCVLSMDPPIQTELSLSKKVKDRSLHIFQGWLFRRVAVLYSMIRYLREIKELNEGSKVYRCLI